MQNKYWCSVNAQLMLKITWQHKCRDWRSIILLLSKARFFEQMKWTTVFSIKVVKSLTRLSFALQVKIMIKITTIITIAITTAMIIITKWTKVTAIVILMTNIFLIKLSDNSKTTHFSHFFFRHFDIQFLHGYYEPTLFILYEPLPTWTGYISAD